MHTNSRFDMIANETTINQRLKDGEVNIYSSLYGFQQLKKTYRIGKRKFKKYQIRRDVQ